MARTLTLQLAVVSGWGWELAGFDTVVGLVPVVSDVSESLFVSISKPVEHRPLSTVGSYPLPLEHDRRLPPTVDCEPALEIGRNEPALIAVFSDDFSSSLSTSAVLADVLDEFHELNVALGPHPISHRPNFVSLVVPALSESALLF